MPSLGDRLFNTTGFRLYSEWVGLPALAALYPISTRFQVTRIGARRSRSTPTWERHRLRGTIAVKNDGLWIHPAGKGRAAVLSYPPDMWRWYGRPEKYHSGRNELILHAETAGGWQVITISIPKWNMQNLVRALKFHSSEALIKAYRRRRPYVHHGPLSAGPAHQDIYGAWTLDPAVTLYLNPACLVILENDRVLRTVALTDVQRIEALRRLDAPGEDGIVRFQVAAEPMAFALREYEAFAASLGSAARRTLEDPIIQKRKGKDDDQDEDDEE
jgi:hypothetical protein